MQVSKPLFESKFPGVDLLNKRLKELVKDTHEKFKARVIADTHMNIQEVLSDFRGSGFTSVKEWIRKEYPKGGGPQVVRYMKDDGTLLPDVKQRVEKDVQQWIDEAYNMYVSRMNSKLLNIAESDKLVDITRISLSVNPYIEAHFKFEFESGSFELWSQFVWVRNSHGTSFTRYPFTFHSIYYPSGAKAMSASLEQVEAAFMKGQKTSGMQQKDQITKVMAMGFYPNVSNYQYGYTMGTLSWLRSGTRGKPRDTIVKDASFDIRADNKYVRVFKSEGPGKLYVEFTDGTIIKGRVLKAHNDKKGAVGIVTEVVALGTNTTPVQLTGMAKQMDDLKKMDAKKKADLTALRRQLAKYLGIVDSDKTKTIEVGSPVYIDREKHKKQIKSLMTTPPFTTKAKDSYELSKPEHTYPIIVHIVYTDGTDVEFKTTPYDLGLYLRDGKLTPARFKFQTNLPGSFSWMRGTVTKINHLGDLATKPLT